MIPKGKAYLDANKKKDGWKVTSDGLQYKGCHDGARGRSRRPRDTVVTQLPRDS